MAHDAQRNFFKGVKAKFPDKFEEVLVIDCGSLDVNGNARDLFEYSQYIGVDIVPGNNVDVVSPVHKLGEHFDRQFDVVISGEMLEHDEYWKESLQKMYDMCKPGGLIVITCAGKGRKEHGTTKTGSQIWGTSNDYYRNLEPKDFQEVFKPEMFSECEYSENTQKCDTYFWGLKIA